MRTSDKPMSVSQIKAESVVSVVLSRNERKSMLMMPRALSREQVEKVWTILVDHCQLAASDSDRESFIAIMTESRLPVQALFDQMEKKPCSATLRTWDFNATSGLAASFRFPEMRVVGRSDHETEAWISALQRANAELRFMVPAGRPMWFGEPLPSDEPAAEFALI